MGISENSKALNFSDVVVSMFLTI